MSETTIIRRSPEDRRTGKTDWARLEAMSDAEIEAAVASDPDAAPILDKSWFERATVVRRPRITPKAPPGLSVDGGGGFCL